MAHLDPDLLDALEYMPASEWDGRAWRHMFNDYPPTQVNTAGARWNPRDIGAIYAAVDRDAAIAEGQHAIDIQPRRIFRQRVVYEIAVKVPGLINLTDPASLESVGLKREDIESNDFTACQEIGRGAAWLGLNGLLVPSARHKGSNLVILVGDLDADDFIEVVSREVIHPGT